MFEFRRRPVVLIAWGQDHGYAWLAVERGENHAEFKGLYVRERVISYACRVSESFLHDIASRRFLFRNLDYGCVFWLVPHDAVSPALLSQVRAKQRQLLAAEEAAAADW